MSLRVALLADRQGQQFHELRGDGAGLAADLTGLLPSPGIVLVHLPWGSDRERYVVLARLNEIRARLAYLGNGQGALILVAPPPWLGRRPPRLQTCGRSVRSIARSP